MTIFISCANILSSSVCHADAFIFLLPIISMEFIFVDLEDVPTQATDHGPHVSSGHLKIRAISTGFLKGWKDILRKSLGVFVRKDTKEKYIFVTGTSDDALHDFYTLNPSRTERIPNTGTLVGWSGNQVFQFDKLANKYPRIYIWEKSFAQEIGVYNTNIRDRYVFYVPESLAPSVKAELRDLQKDPSLVNWSGVYH